MQNPASLTAPAVASPQTNQPRPLITHRVVIRATKCALRRTDDIDRPSFGHPDLYRDQLCEFPSDDTAQMAIDYVRYQTAMGHVLRPSDSLVIETIVWNDLTQMQENAVLCRVRDTSQFLGWIEMRHLLTNVRRGFLGLARRAS